MTLGQQLPTVARQFGSQHTAAISLNSRRSFSHEAPRSSLRLSLPQRLAANRIFGSAGFVPNVHTVEFGSAGKGSSFQLLPRSLERAMAPEDPGVKSPNPNRMLLGSEESTAIPRR